MVEFSCAPLSCSLCINNEENACKHGSEGPTFDCYMKCGIDDTNKAD